jgi:uncharacterized protein YjbI with pentapeptide repeats
MADAEHLAILSKGVTAWNAWRRTRPKIDPDLSEANLEGKNLAGANLSRTDLERAVLIRANLESADLSEANLSAANLNEANLLKANLRSARLRKASVRNVKLTRTVVDGTDFADANLSGSDFSEVDWGRFSWKTILNPPAMPLFQGANLSGANLTDMSFWDADLTDTDFTGAILTDAYLGDAVLAGAFLVGADLSGAYLKGVDLTNATIGRTIFGGNDLSTAKGLETVEHQGPTTIGVDTIFRSGGNIPDSFLCGCGIPSDFITYMKSLTGKTIEFYSCFISYSTKDQEFAEQLHADLQNKGVRCWFAPHDVQSGRKLHEQIDEAIRLHDKLLLILSPNSMASEWVKTEIAKARRREIRDNRRVLFPIRVAPFETRDWECFDADTGKDSAREIREYFIPDFSNWKDHDSYQEAFKALIRDLKAQDSKVLHAR